MQGINQLTNIPMKKLYSTAIAIIIAFTISAQAQPPSIEIQKMPDETPNTTVSIPVYVDFTGDNVCSIDLEISFDEGVLQFVDLSNVESLGGSPLVSQTTSPIIIGWNTTANQHVGKIFDLQFDYSGGYSALTFENINVVGGTAIFDCTGSNNIISISVGTNDAFINGPTTSVPIAFWSLLVLAGLMVAFFVRRLF